MRLFIKAADFQRYNANSSGNHTGDCVKRALSLALDISYNDISKMLNNKMKELRRNKWNIRQVYGPVMRENGCSDWLSAGTRDNNNEPVTLAYFVDNVVDPNEIYLVHTGTRLSDLGNVKTNHIVCVRNGKVWDTWDSRKEYVSDYAVVESGQSKQIVEKFSLGVLAHDYIEPLIHDEISKYANRRKWMLNSLELSVVRAINYQVKIDCTFLLKATELIEKNRRYSFSVICPIEPTMDEQEALDHMMKIAKIRTYDRMYAINEQEKKLKEAAEIKQSAEMASSNRTLFLDKREAKFLNSLPGWVQPIVTFFSIDYPGQYHDSYKLNIRPLPSDSKHAGRQRLEFEAYTATDLKEMLNRYKKNFEIPFEDYDPFEEY